MRKSIPRLRVIGCGEAFDSGSGNNSCILYDGEGGVPASKARLPVILFDCGYQIPERLWVLNDLYRKIDGVYLTHTHADHVFGLVPLLVRYSEEGRKAPFKVLGPRGVKTYLTRLLDLGYPGAKKRFKFKLDFVELKDGDSVRWGDLEFTCARSDHSVVNLAVRVEGLRRLAGLSFAISGDGALNQKTQTLYQGVRVLLHEVYSREPELLIHCDLKSLSKFAAGSAIERVGITHICRNEKPQVHRLYSQLLQKDSRYFVLEPGMEILVMAGS